LSPFLTASDLDILINSSSHPKRKEGGEVDWGSFAAGGKDEDLLFYYFGYIALYQLNILLKSH
jgi:hypothetical protein